MTFAIYRISAMSTVGYITMHKESSLWHLLRPDDTQHVLFPPVEVLSAVISLPVAADYQRITVPISSEKINLIICKRNYSSLEEIQLSQGYVRGKPHRCFISENVLRLTRLASEQTGINLIVSLSWLPLLDITPFFHGNLFIPTIYVVKCEMLSRMFRDSWAALNIEFLKGGLAFSWRSFTKAPWE